MPRRGTRGNLKRIPQKWKTRMTIIMMARMSREWRRVSIASYNPHLELTYHGCRKMFPRSRKRRRKEIHVWIPHVNAHMVVPLLPPLRAGSSYPRVRPRILCSGIESRRPHWGLELEVALPRRVEPWLPYAKRRCVGEVRALRDIRGREQNQCLTSARNSHGPNTQRLFKAA